MPERLAYTVTETAHALGISRTVAYELVRRGSLPHLRIGRTIRIPADALSDWMNQHTTTTKGTTT